MTAKTDPAASSAAASSPPGVESPSAPLITTQRKPHFALFIATAAGLGYLPKAPGTWGSLVGLAFAAYNLWQSKFVFAIETPPNNGSWSDVMTHTSFISWQIGFCLAVSLLGVWAADHAEKYFKTTDPQMVVVDEVSGQSIAYLGLLTAGPVPHYWKYLLLGFILFRVFDIWKPFPARQAEALPGGWGIMADDWIAGIYAAIGLWLARAAGL
jgi:phosphatidylglycerophosphatase A